MDIQKLVKIYGLLKHSEPIKGWFGMSQTELGSLYWKVYFTDKELGHHHDFVVQWDVANPQCVGLYQLKDGKSSQLVANEPVDAELFELLLSALRALYKERRVNELLFGARQEFEAQASEEFEAALIS